VAQVLIWTTAFPLRIMMIAAVVPVIRDVRTEFLPRQLFSANLTRIPRRDLQRLAATTCIANQRVSTDLSHPECN
jgi:hypothetical protein